MNVPSWYYMVIYWTLLLMTLVFGVVTREASLLAASIVMFGMLLLRWNDDER